MKKHFLPLLICLLGTVMSAGAQSTAQIQEYINKYKLIAMEEMRRTGVPAAITLAQGIHETGAGTSDLVLSSNNHFGIKCKDDWQGERVFHDDDAKGECFRKYSDPRDSYRDHSDFLKNRPYYASLFNLDPTDYEGWAYGLKKAGYATNPRYPQILIKLINDYHLEDYTDLAMKEGPLPDQPIFASATITSESNSSAHADVRPAVAASYPATGTFQINNTDAILVKEGTSFLLVAEQHHMDLNKLFELNDMQPEDIASRDMVMFIARKKKTGNTSYHVCVAGETLRDVAQAEGVRLEELARYNGMNITAKMNSGQIIYLNDKHQGPVAQPAVLTTTAIPSSTSSRPEPVMYKVQSKETLYSIAKKYNVSVEDIMTWNHLDNHDLHAGQTIKIFQ